MDFLRREVFLGQHLWAALLVRRSLGPLALWVPSKGRTLSQHDGVLGISFSNNCLGSPQLPKLVSCTVSSQIIEENDKSKRLCLVEYNAIMLFTFRRKLKDY